MKTEKTFNLKELSEVEQKILLLVQQRKRCRMSEVASTVSVFCAPDQKELTAQIWRLVDLNYLTRLLDSRALNGKVPDHQVELSPQGLSACQQLQEKKEQTLKQKRQAAADKRQQNRFQVKMVVLGGVVTLIAEHILVPLIKLLLSLIF